jgi:16S rRNA (uracil1498-N3)-methyltransferase
MQMARRRWIANEWDEESASLTGARALHLARVLRAQPGMQYEVVAGARVRLGTVISVTEGTVQFALGEELEADRALPLTLLLAVFKFDRMEWAIEKTTELGVAHIVPVVARRTEKHLAQAALARTARWRRIAEEASRQSRRAQVPVVDEPVPLAEALRQRSGGSLLLLDESEQHLTIAEALGGNDEGELALAVGPEGGWTDEERALFRVAGWRGVSLGPRVLRAETAAIAAAAVAGALLG